MTEIGKAISHGLLAAAVGVIGGWSAYAGVSWLRYGRPRRPLDPDRVLDRFMPWSEVVERHQTEVAAPASVTFAAAREMDLNRSAAVRAIFRGRELLLGSARGGARTGSFVDQTLALGWGVLAEEPGYQIVVGAVTQPWQADVKFRAVPPADFAAFSTPGFAKIIWTLSAHPLGPTASLFRTETRVTTTDPNSRWRFRLYWSIFSPGILVIRNRSLRLVKADAERRFREQRMVRTHNVIGSASDIADSLRPMGAT